MLAKAWELMDECARCGVPARVMCRNLKQSHVEIGWPHAERKRLPEHLTKWQRAVARNKLWLWEARSR